MDQGQARERQRGAPLPNAEPNRCVDCGAHCAGERCGPCNTGIFHGTTPWGQRLPR